MLVDLAASRLGRDPRGQGPCVSPLCPTQARHNTGCTCAKIKPTFSISIKNKLQGSCSGCSTIEKEYKVT